MFLRELNGLRQTVSDIVVPKKGQAHFGAKPFSGQQSKVCIVSGFLHYISPHHQEECLSQMLPDVVHDEGTWNCLECRTEQDPMEKWFNEDGHDQNIIVYRVGNGKVYGGLDYDPFGKTYGRSVRKNLTF